MRIAPALMAFALTGCGTEQRETPRAPEAASTAPADASTASADAGTTRPASAGSASEPRGVMMGSKNRARVAGIVQSDLDVSLGRFTGLPGPGTGSRERSGLSRGEIDRVVEARQGALRACYQHELARAPDLGGKLVVTFVIAPDGAVSAATIEPERSTLDDERVRACVVREFQQLRFPARGGGRVRYPLVFAPADD